MAYKSECACAQSAYAALRWATQKSTIGKLFFDIVLT